MNIRNFVKKDALLKYNNSLITALRFGLGIIFLWFGLLKMFSSNPVFELVYNSLFPQLADGAGLVILGLVEVFIGVMLILNKMLLTTHFALLLHLLGTFTTFIFGWHVIFDPIFPILSLDGEFVVKNITLAISGLVVLIHELRYKYYKTDNI